MIDGTASPGSPLALIVDLVRGIVWPLGVGLFVFWFRHEIASLLRRVSKLNLGSTGIDLSADQSEKLPQTLSEPLLFPSSDPAAIDHLKVSVRDVPMRPLIKEGVDELKRNLDAFQRDQREEVLLRALSQLRLIAFFENTYSSIFGSQIRSLQLLNAPGKIPVDEARCFFEEHAKGPNPEAYADTTFDAWLNYLIGRGLVIRNQDFVEITEKGREFILFLFENRYPDNKAL